METPAQLLRAEKIKNTQIRGQFDESNKAIKLLIKNYINSNLHLLEEVDWEVKHRYGVYFSLTGANPFVELNELYVQDDYRIWNDKVNLFFNKNITLEPGYEKMVYEGMRYVKKPACAPLEFIKLIKENNLKFSIPNEVKSEALRSIQKNQEILDQISCFENSQ